jgi:hypothetical protein
MPTQGFHLLLSGRHQEACVHLLLLCTWEHWEAEKCYRGGGQIQVYCTPTCQALGKGFAHEGAYLICLGWLRSTILLISAS